MPRYAHGLELVDSVRVGPGAGGSLTTGERNVLLGPAAGSLLTSGSGNIVLGSGSPKSADDTGQVVLSNVTGKVLAIWDAHGNVQLTLRDTISVANPSGPGWMCLGYDLIRGSLVFKHNDGSAVRSSWFRSEDDIRGLLKLQDSPSTGFSLIYNENNRQLNRLVAGAKIAIDDTSGALQIRYTGSLSYKYNLVDFNVSYNFENLRIGGPVTGELETVAVGPGSLQWVASTQDRILARFPFRLTAIGCNTLNGLANTQSDQNNLTAVGYRSMYNGGMVLQSVGMGSQAMYSIGNNTSLATSSNNVAVGYLSLQANTSNPIVECVALGNGSLSRLSAGNGNVALGHEAGCLFDNGSYNVTVGWRSADNGSGNYSAPGTISGSGNILLGASSGMDIQNGSNNVVIGGRGIVTGDGNTLVGAFNIAGTTTMSNSVVLSAGSGPTRLAWLAGALNAVHTVDGVETSLTADNTMTFAYSTTTGGLVVLIRLNVSTQQRIDLTNERPLNPTNVTVSGNLLASHRNRFTRIVASSAVNITVVVYSGIVVGSEYEFYNAGSNGVTFVPGSGVTLRSTNALVNLPTYGAVVLKYLGSSIFLLCGSLE